jgi:transcriptional pleiotropic regulator of transition state genes
MRSTGVTRGIDSLGRIVIPKEIRRNFKIAEGDALEIFVDGETLVLKKYEPGCMMCGEMDNLKSFKGKQLCSECLKNFK